MNANELRKKYLEFFKERGHQIVPSGSLIPENDPTTLFTGSGMQPMIPYLMGEKHPLGGRIADSQKSFRAGDIEEVGDNRHTTFFEMLGNWSLGDYFKKEQIGWMFEFLTKEIGLDPKKIYVTVFRGDESLKISRDDESVVYWQELFKSINVEALAVDNAEIGGMQNGRIFYYPVEKNWWSRAGVPNNMPLGEPGGPDSEMFWDFGVELKIHENSQWRNQPCHVNCDCGRFLEIGNNVFMQYIKTQTGFELLKQQNVDFGGGLERILAAINGNPDMFLTDIFAKAKAEIEKLSGKKYEDNKEAFRVILDHLRAATFLIADGAYPGNKDQGYFVRRLIRRAVRFAHKLGIENNFCSDIAKIYIKYYQDAYTDLLEKSENIFEELEKEEEKFRKTLEKGLKEFDKAVGNFLSINEEGDFLEINDNEDKLTISRELSGKIVFNLYATYGFPIELIREIAKEKNIKIDEEKFKEEFAKHQELSRTASAGKFKGGLADHSEKITALHTATHLMLAGLRRVLGENVHQKGSNITEERIRFDFSHSDKMTEEQKKAVEDYVNEAINSKTDIVIEEMTLDEAREKGAEGAFENKYGERVKVYFIAGFSNEICGGPHVRNTGDIEGVFKIKKEESSSAGVRRIKAVVE
ncbi:MAG: alanyl-tRNA synthetase [Candidatus Moranbacteria bacterium GW2011_GWF2_36_839]|nr:MAG: alanyl-tRNA synthetase [Candidatus Moranbacteria bacterium GW2011_GWF1_36_78]KKQ16811.1 MAG: alanyl-tRNA synthetase [Candidatus Moranbacteria bacterium GW2011_GWF2_36_839]HAT73614.1 alanine--tRNA ligase [Candidatus Moranbacteria bacterium]HBY10574.1 alanine--tRNA ligase [Candidatus Moranbacteria bacterium]